MEYAEGVWEIFKMFAAGLGVFVGVVVGVGTLITKWGPIARRISAHRIRKRLETCPQKTLCAPVQCNQETMISELKTIALLAQGGTIALHCTIATQRGYLSLFDRAWLQNAYEAYSSAGGNHGVDKLYEDALLLPDMPTHKRRVTD